MLKKDIKEYRRKAEEALGEMLHCNYSGRMADAIAEASRNYMDVLRLEKALKKENSGFTRDDAEHWAYYLKNADGTTGAHWTIEQTTAVAEANGVYFEHIHDWHWWIAINMIYSDYCKTALEFGADVPKFYAELAKAFLFDEDGPGPVQKLSAYYHYIACPK